MKILIADDERDICEAVCKIVERAGHTCLCVYDGALALAAFEREQPDVVILDVMMPEVNGFDLCRDLRARDPHVPIMMLSAKSDIVDKGVGFAAGCDDYVAKPFNSQELAMRIEALLRRARLADEGRSRARSRAVVRLGDMEIRLKRNEVLVHGRYVNLTPKEFQIIAFLGQSCGRRCSRPRTSWPTCGARPIGLEPASIGRVRAQDSQQDRGRPQQAPLPANHLARGLPPRRRLDDRGRLTKESPRRTASKRGVSALASRGASSSRMGCTHISTLLDSTTKISWEVFGNVCLAHGARQRYRSHEKNRQIGDCCAATGSGSGLAAGRGRLGSVVAQKCRTRDTVSLR